MRIELVKTIATAGSLILAGVTHAGEKFSPYFSAETGHNSNLFARSDQAVITSDPDPGTIPIIGIPVPGQQPGTRQSGDPTQSDTTQRYVAGLAVKLPWGNQRARATLEGRRVEFDRFSQLDHDEYLVGGGLDWRLTDSGLDGALDYKQERRQASFEDRSEAALTLDDERLISASLNRELTPDWRLETGLRARKLESPLPLSPDFQLQENTISGALKYLLVDTLSAGMLAEYLAGEFENIPGARKFHQETLALTTEYPVPTLGSIGAQLGYTRRTDEDSSGGGISALTGMFNYLRQATGKTSIDLRIFRRVRSGVRGAESVIENGAGATLIWATTNKISITTAYEFTDGRFQGDFQEEEDETLSSSRSGVKEKNQLASVTLNYQMLRWLAIRAHGGYQDRDSQRNVDTFDATTTGIELRAVF